MTAAQVWRNRLRDGLLAARKDRDTLRVSALRSALSVIDNAETPSGASIDAPDSGTVAGAVVGLGAAEVARRELVDGEIRALLRGEVDERLIAAEQFTAVGHTERAGRCGKRRRCSPTCSEMSEPRARLKSCSS
jgi:hypothetical protein